MSSTGFTPRPTPTWQWSGAGMPGQDAELHQRVSGAFHEDAAAPSPPVPGTEPAPEAERAETRPPRNYGPRTCRICLETVYPTTHLPSMNLPDFLQSRTPRVTYESEDPASGRLLRPCKCRGSSRYAHEGCLNQWRKANTSTGNGNYWTCPTCGFRYRLERMSWGRWINNQVTQILMTVAICVLVIFVLGFVADPIIAAVLDPEDVVSYGVEKIPLDRDGEGSWAEHFVKGMASLGLLGVFHQSMFIVLNPQLWWSYRTTGILGSGRQGTGRDRLAGVTWIVILMGILTFAWAVFKGVRSWSRRTLEMASERVMDVRLDVDEEDEEEPIPPPAT